MTSFHILTDPKARYVGRFISKVRDELLRALWEEKSLRGLSQAEIAGKIGVHPSVISRELSGEANLTLKRVAELAWAIGREPDFSLIEPITELSSQMTYSNAINLTVELDTVGGSLPLRRAA